jgi:hypothetical protein
MIYDVLMVVARLIGGVAAATVLAFGFGFLIFLADADARDKPLVSSGFDRLAVVVIYLSWFAPLWWFGFDPVLLMVGCAVTVALCIVYASSYRATVWTLRSGGRVAGGGPVAPAGH